MSNLAPERDLKKEAVGWFSMILIMLAFPALFFVCVFMPMWMGWIVR